MRRIRPPSPSMAVAIAALVIAVAGTAVAAVGTISTLTKNDKKQIRKIAGKVADQRIRQMAAGLTVKSAASADSATLADRARTADSAKVADTAAVAGDVSNQLWAIVHADGTLFRATPGIVESSRNGDGKYVVLADRDLSGCFFTATLGGDTPEQGLRGDISANLVGGSKAVFVLTSSNAEQNSDRPFTLLISC